MNQESKVVPMDIKEMLKQFAPIIDAEIAKVIPKKHELPNLYDAMWYFLGTGGKRWRPFLCLAVCEAFGGKKEEALPFAAAIELTHHFSLIHDDIEDGDEYRRDKPTVWKKYGVPHAINIGDSMFVKIFESALRERKYLPEEKVNQLIYILTDSMTKLVEGQTMDINFRGRDDVTEEEYMEMVWRKTGALIGAALAGGALIADTGKKVQKALFEYAKKIGPAFQIRDDLIDIDQKAWKGRKGEIGCDIKEGKRTLMVIHCLGHANKEDRELLLKILNKERNAKTEEEVKEAIKILERNGSIDYAKKVTERLVKEAKEILKIIPAEKRKFLEEFTDFLVERKF